MMTAASHQILPLLLDSSNLWRFCPRKAAHTDSPGSICASSYRLSPECLDGQLLGSRILLIKTVIRLGTSNHINMDYTVLERLHKCLSCGVPGEFYRSIVVVGDPAHVPNSLNS